MARSAYIYLIYQYDFLLSAHTVKREAHEWLSRSRWTHRDPAVRLTRMRDGVTKGDWPDRKAIEWDETLFSAEHLEKPTPNFGDTQGYTLEPIYG